MNYITVTQLSERWNVTPRYIQNLCRDGRLPGIERFGKSWMIPENIERPADHRCKGASETAMPFAARDEICPSVMCAAYRVPGTADDTINSLADNPYAAALTKAQFAYLRGDIDTSAELAEKLFKCANEFEIKAGAVFLMGICAMYRGDVACWLNAGKLLESLECADEGYTARKELWQAVYGASIYDMSAYPEWLKRGCFDSLPLGYYPAARVHYAKYLYLCGDAMVKNQPLDGKSFSGQLFLLPAVCEPLISQTSAEKAIVSEIYLRLICASSYHHAGKDCLAAEHIDRAIELAMPDEIYAPFAEQRLNLDSLTDDRLKKVNPAAIAKLKLLHGRLMSGWSAIHNTVLHCSHTNELTAKELEAARLAVFGLTNKEIAGRMGISINSVKNYLQTAKDKTGVKKRSELAKFV